MCFATMALAPRFSRHPLSQEITFPLIVPNSLWPIHHVAMVPWLLVICLHCDSLQQLFAVDVGLFRLERNFACSVAWCNSYICELLQASLRFQKIPSIVVWVSGLIVSLNADWLILCKLFAAHEAREFLIYLPKKRFGALIGVEMTCPFWSHTCSRGIIELFPH